MKLFLRATPYILLIVLVFHNLSAIPSINNKDSIVLDKLLSRGEEIYIDKPDSAIYYWKKVVIMVDNMKSSVGKLNSSNTYLQSKATALNNIGYVYEYQGKNVEAIDYYNKTLALQIEMKDYTGMAVTYSNIGLNLHNQGKVIEGLSNFELAYKFDLMGGSQEGISRSLNNIGLSHDNLGNVVKALEYYKESLKIKELIKDSLGIAITVNNIALIHQSQNDYISAKRYLEQCFEIQTKIRDLQGAARSLNNIGAIYKERDVNDSALIYFKDALKIQFKIKEKKGIAYSYNNIGSMYNILGLKDTALTYYKKALSLYKEIEYSKGICISLDNIAYTEWQQKDFKKAIDHAKKAMAYAKDVGFVENIKKVAKTLKLIYTSIEDYKCALEMYELEMVMHDSIVNETNNKASVKQQFQYQYEKKAAADSVKNAEEQKVKNAQLIAQQAQLKQEKTQRFALYGGLLLVIAFSGFVFNRFKVTQKQNTIIEKQKGEVDKAYHQLHEKNKEVMDSIHYAARIQRSLITNEKYIASQLGKLRKLEPN